MVLALHMVKYTEYSKPSPGSEGSGCKLFVFNQGVRGLSLARLFLALVCPIPVHETGDRSKIMAAILVPTGLIKYVHVFADVVGPDAKGAGSSGSLNV